MWHGLASTCMAIVLTVVQWLEPILQAISNVGSVFSPERTPPVSDPNYILLVPGDFLID